MYKTVVRLCILLFFLHPPSLLAQFRNITPETTMANLIKLRTERADPNVFFRFQSIVDCVIGGVCLASLRLLLFNEITIRSRFHTHGESCNYYKNSKFDTRLILNPPDVGTPPNIPYLTWQTQILDSDQFYCDTYKNHFCHKSSTCQCLPTTVWEPSTGFCNIAVGEPCIFDDLKLAGEHNFFEGLEQAYHNTLVPAYLDPLGVLYQYTAIPIPPPECPAKDCHRVSYFMEGVCSSNQIVSESRSLRNHFDSVSRATIGEICNFKDHQSLYTLTAEEKANRTLRRETLDTLRSKNNRFCDVSQFFTCFPNNKCGCMPPSVLDGSRCILKAPFDNCGTNPMIEAITKNTSAVQEGRDRIRTAVANRLGGCPSGLTCYTDSSSPDMDRFCTCPDRKYGLTCNKNLSSLIPNLRTSAYAIDVTEDQALRLYDEVNKAASIFETFLRIPVGGKCDFTTELVAERTFILLHELVEPGSQLTRSWFNNIISDMQSLTQIPHVQANGVCDRLKFKGVECGERDGVCLVPSRAQRTEELIRRLKVFEVLGCGATCDYNIKSFNSILTKAVENGKLYTNYEEAADKLEDIWANRRTRFCKMENVDANPCLKDKATSPTGHCECPKTIEQAANMTGEVLLKRNKGGGGKEVLGNKDGSTTPSGQDRGVKIHLEIIVLIFAIMSLY